MSTIFIIGETNDPQRLWVVDTGKGTVQPLSSGTGSGAIDQGLANTVQGMRRNGFAVLKGVDVAIAAPVDRVAELTSRQLTENG